MVRRARTAHPSGWIRSASRVGFAALRRRTASRRCAPRSGIRRRRRSESANDPESLEESGSR